MTSKKPHKLRQRKCIICGTKFRPKTSTQLLCGCPECRRLRKAQLAKQNAERAKERQQKYRRKKSVKAKRAIYDKQYQQEHKEQIKAYKKMWFARKQFYKYLATNTILQDNAYWISLTKEEQTQVLKEYYTTK